MSAQHTPGPWAKYEGRCYGSGQAYTCYASEHRPDANNVMPCPVCGKAVKLRAKYPKARGQPARHFVVLPWHSRAAIAKATGSGS